MQISKGWKWKANKNPGNLNFAKKNKDFFPWLFILIFERRKMNKKSLLYFFGGTVREKGRKKLVKKKEMEKEPQMNFRYVFSTGAFWTHKKTQDKKKREWKTVNNIFFHPFCFSFSHATKNVRIIWGRFNFSLLQRKGIKT